MVVNRKKHQVLSAVANVLNGMTGDSCTGRKEISKPLQMAPCEANGNAVYKTPNQIPELGKRSVAFTKWQS